MNRTVSKMFCMIIYPQKGHSTSKVSKNTDVKSYFEEILSNKFLGIFHMLLFSSPEILDNFYHI